MRVLLDFHRRYWEHVACQLAKGWDGYWQRHRVLIGLLLIAAAADTATTIYFMSADGIHHEINPGYRAMCLHLGPWLGAPLGKLLQLAMLLLVTLYWRRVAHLYLFAAAMMYGWAAWYNLFGRDLYTPALFAWLQ